MIPAHRGPLARTIATSVLVAVAVLASMYALTVVIDPGAWTVAGVQGVVLVAGTTGVVRYLVGRNALARAERARAAARAQGLAASASPDNGPAAFWSTAAGVAVAAWFVLARFGAPTQRTEFFAGPAALDRVVARFGQATTIMRDEVAPVDDSLQIGLVAVGSTLLVLLVADSLAGARMPGLAVLPLLLLWLPALTLLGDVPAWVFVVVVTAALLLLTVDPVGVTPGRRIDSRDPAIRRAQRRRAGITAVTSLLVAVLALGAGSGVSAIPSVAGSFSQLIATQARAVQLAEELDMTRPLGERSSEVVFTYRTEDGTNVGPLRLRTITSFDGFRTQRAIVAGGGREFDERDMLWPGGFPDDGAKQEVTVTMRALTTEELPLPVDPRSVAADGDWEYYNVRDEVRSEDATRDGDVYSLTVHDRGLDAEVLRAATGQDPGTEGYLEVAATAHSDDIAALADRVAGSAPTRYDQAVALQQFLRDPVNFTYDPAAEYLGSEDPVWDFLEEGDGYCVQYAAAMMVMARTLGIPTRLGVGYLPGERTQGDVWRVTGQQSHTWPEVFFPGAGWVRFEPTPAVQTGPLPAYADPALAAPAPAPPVGPEEVPTAAPSANPTTGPSATAGAPGAGAGAGAGSEPLPAWAWVLAVLVAALTLGGGAWWLVRRRSEVEVLDPERAWSRVLAVLAERDVVLPPSTTLRRAPEAIGAQVRARTGAPLTDDLAELLVALADAAERERYARGYTPPAPEQLEELTTTVSEALAGVLARKP